jgi:hypothetical protein
MRTTLAAAVGSTCLIVASTVQAEDDPVLVSMAWTRMPGAESCVDQERLEDEVELRLERNVFVAPSRAQLRIRGSIAPVPDSVQWVASLEARDMAGKIVGVRVVRSEAERCDDLDGAIALVLAVAIDSAKKKIVLHVPSPAPRPRSELPLWQGKVAPTMWSAVGLLPGLAMGAGLRASVEAPSFWPVELDFTGYLPKRKEHNGRGVELVGWHAGALLCPRVVHGDGAALGLCLGGQVGVLQGAGFGFPVTQQVDSTMANAISRLVLEIPLGRVEPRLGVGALVPLVRDRFVYEVGEAAVELHRASPIVLSLDLGLALRVP